MARIEHGVIGQEIRHRQKSASDAPEARLRPEDFKSEAAADEEDERDDQGLDVAKAFVLEKEDGKDVESGEADARR